MVIVKYFIECDFYSKEKLLKYYDLVIGHAFPLLDYYKNYEVKSKNSKITAQEFKSLANDLRKEIEENLVEDDDGELSDIQDQLTEGSIFSANSDTIQDDLEDGDSLEFSDSIIVQDDFIIITYLDPSQSVDDYLNSWHLEVTSASEKDLWKEGIEEDGGLQIQIKDEMGGFSQDTYEILNLS